MLAQTCPWNQTHRHCKFSKLTLWSSSLAGKNPMLRMRAELSTSSCSLSGLGTGGVCLMLQPSMTTSLLLLNTEWIFCTHLQTKIMGKWKPAWRVSMSQPASEQPFTWQHRQKTNTKSKSPNQQKLLSISTDSYSSPCSHSFGMKLSGSTRPYNYIKIRL